MIYLLDTNVLSEPLKKSPDPTVIAWLATLGEAFVISAVSMEELRYGALRMSEGARKRRILSAIESICVEYGSKIVPFTAEDAAICAGLRMKSWGAGNNVAYQDLAICATALRMGVPVATRNTRDFKPLGVEVYNPFSDA